MHPATRRLQRGVYTVPYLSRSGHKIYVAIDHRGRFLTHALVFDRESAPAVADMLRGVLERLDPPD